MKFDRVTITGADDSISPQMLIDLSAKYPFVEWGILISKNSAGARRFPTHGWRTDLQRACRGLPINLSLHLCGSWLQELCMGDNNLPVGCAERFDRIQLNFHGEETRYDSDALAMALYELRIPEIIFQIDGAQGQEILSSVYSNKQAFTCSPLFDLSHGAGVLPMEWPGAFDAASYHGYAGGLGPDNLEAQIPLIADAADGARFWIDMETKVRSRDGGVFALDKVERCLQIAQRFIES